ncbi:MAG: hypothetical protein KGS45_10030 [Planctomycetes bacterium]|nr:hypothetical protein [Planctomycetota bacterium]
MLLKYGANPNAVWKGEAHTLIPLGATPLMVQRYDDTNLIKTLLKHGADPQARCTQGRTALDYAKDAAGHPQVIGNEAVAKCVTILEKVTKV